MSYDAVRQWCIGENLPDGARLLAIRDKFGISIDWLLTDQGPMQAAIPAVCEQTEPYGASPHRCAFCGDMTDEIKDLCRRLKTIIESGHKTAVPALISNLAAFEDSVKQSEEIEKQKQEIDTLKKTVRHHSKLLDSGHHAGSGRAAGAGIRKGKM